MRESDIVLMHDDWMLAKLTADRRMKASNGHCFETILKTRCMWCRRSPRAKGRCGAWFRTFLWHLDAILMNVDKERVLWAAAREEKRDGTHGSR